MGIEHGQTVYSTNEVSLGPLLGFADAGLN
jgi:hypothetical protein